MAEHASPQQTEEEYLAAERAKLHDDVLAALRRARQAGMRGAYIDTSTLFAISQAILDSAVSADLRQQLAEANADCKRANELINAAVDDYNEARARALEEAAQAASPNSGSGIFNSYEHGRRDAAAAIRALAAGREG